MVANNKKKFIKQSVEDDSQQELDNRGLILLFTSIKFDSGAKRKNTVC
jgi:hypothetical protein